MFLQEELVKVDGITAPRTTLHSLGSKTTFTILDESADLRHRLSKLALPR